ncbi:MAG: restriction endonuclease [Anaerolineae bacterium]|nr:restriction endonuclease [Anaerolineae bacterium]
MPRKGRDLEILVATVERMLSGTDIEIKSPDKIEGINSKSLREVDVSLRANVGSLQVLVIIEVRDRKNTEDVTWIEQLATKKEDVQASKAVAVSSSGFSGGAKNTADKLGIELRSIEQITTEAISSWFHLSNLEVRPPPILSGVLLGTDDSVNQDLENWLREACTTNAPIFIHIRTGKARTIKALFQEVLDQNPQLLYGLEPGGRTKPMNLLVNYSDPSNRYQIQFGEKVVNITQIGFSAKLPAYSKKVPISQITQYIQVPGDKSIAQSVHFEFEVDDKVFNLAFHKTEERHDSYITLHTHQKEEGN